MTVSSRNEMDVNFGIINNSQWKLVFQRNLLLGSHLPRPTHWWRIECPPQAAIILPDRYYDLVEPDSKDVPITHVLPGDLDKLRKVFGDLGRLAWDWKAPDLISRRH